MPIEDETLLRTNEEVDGEGIEDAQLFWRRERGDERKQGIGVSECERRWDV